MRTIETFAKSSSTYHFTITDFADLGFSQEEIDDLNIGMVIYNGNKAVYILPQTYVDVPNGDEEYLSYPDETEDFEVVVIKSNLLCRKLAESKFSVTVPVSAEMSGSCQYQVFLFKKEMLERVSIETAQGGTRSLRGGLNLLTMMVIDNGIIKFNSTLLPSYPENSLLIDLDRDGKGDETEEIYRNWWYNTI
jgi:hypothetical protein